LGGIEIHLFAKEHPPPHFHDAALKARVDACNRLRNLLWYKYQPTALPPQTLASKVTHEQDRSSKRGI